MSALDGTVERKSLAAVGGTVAVDFDDALSMFLAAVGRYPTRTMIAYFDGELTFRQVDEESTAFANALRSDGFDSGDRLAIIAQNIPHFVIALIGAWKAGGIAVPINPMVSDDELRFMLADADVNSVVCEESRIGTAAWLEGVVLRAPVISMCPYDYQTADDPRALPPRVLAEQPGTRSFAALIAAHAGELSTGHIPRGDDIASITYTSGTTGRPKGAMNRHESLAFSGQVYRDWIPLTDHDKVLGVPPMSTITGLAIGLASTLISGCTYVINYRFELSLLVDVIQTHRPTFLVGPPTLYTALLSEPTLEPEDLASLAHVYAGAAPVSAVLVERWKTRFGQDLRTAYGMTEATGPTHLAQVGQPVPVDEATGALSIGIPVFNTSSRIVNPEGSVDDAVMEGEIGELIVRGPQMIRGYWRNPEATKTTIEDGWVRTGDLAVRHGDGYFIVDRLKDIIITSGNNVAPRQVEDCLLAHPSVREAAVVGVPDDYRGEAIRAFVVLAEETVTAPELIAYCRERLSPYKVPRAIDFVDDLPKNVSGKVLRRVLRDRALGVAQL